MENNIEVKITVDTSEIDRAQEKFDKLIEALEKAKSLADEMAFGKENIRTIMRDLDSQTDLINTKVSKKEFDDFSKFIQCKLYQ